MYNISLRGAILSSLLMFFLIIYPIAMPGQHQVYAQDSTMTMDLAKLLANDAIHALNHKDINGALENLRLIGQQFPQAFAQNSTMAMDLAKLLANDAIQALDHKDINGALEHLRVIGEVGISANSTSILASKLPTHPGSHISTNTSKVGHLMNPSSGVMVRLK
ncbi:MAG: hypothetical protein WBZ36_14430 [Candidatus Nitrosopolaris sp.]